MLKAVSIKCFENIVESSDFRRVKEANLYKKNPHELFFVCKHYYDRFKIFLEHLA